MGSMPSITAPAGTTGALSVPLLIWRNVLPTMPSVCSPHVESLRTSWVSPPARASGRETVGRSGRDNDLKNLTGVEPGQPDLAADLQPCDLAERGVQLELSGEKKPPVSDEEQRARKQQHASHDEGTNDDPHSTHD